MVTQLPSEEAADAQSLERLDCASRIDQDHMLMNC